MIAMVSCSKINCLSQAMHKKHIIIICRITKQKEGNCIRESGNMNGALVYENKPRHTTSEYIINIYTSYIHNLKVEVNSHLLQLVLLLALCAG